MFERHGVRLPRATQAAWMIGLIVPLQPLLNLMDERLRSSGYVRIDETRVQVLNSDKAPSALHWMWVRVAGPKHQRIILFDYDPSRGGEVADALIEGCSGYLQSDGYQAYEGASARAGLIHVGCFAHARRRFFEALKALPNAQRKQPSAAHEAVRRIDALYLIERQIKDLSDGERSRIRGEETIPLLASLHEWASQMQHDTMPSGKLGDALGYLITQWPKLARYVEDPRLAIDTNLAENAIRPFALGRRYPRFVIMEGYLKLRSNRRAKDRCRARAISEPNGIDATTVPSVCTRRTMHNYKLCRNRRTSSLGRYRNGAQAGA
jgi:transposase